MAEGSAPAAAGADRYAVVGHPVEHSQSPFIHAAFAAQTGEPVEYGRLEAPLDGFAAAVRGFAAAGARGCNVTVPFKFEAHAIATRLSARAARAGACNLLRFDADGWFGDNTDGAGLVRDIEFNAGVSLAGQRVLLLGAGGAAAGVLGPLLEAGPAELVLANRTPEKAQALLAGYRTGGALRSRLVSAALDACGEGYDIVINATASSLQAVAVPVAAAVLKPGSLALDLMYGAAARPFLDWAAAHGAHGRDGLGMLVEQAAEAFFVWRGVRPDTMPVLAALRERL
jgi:shikimate dehydrogenase